MKKVFAKWGGRFGAVVLSIMVSFSLLSSVFGEDLEQGKKLFEEKCSRCHSLDGLGNSKMAAILKVPLKKIDLVHGKGGLMTPYEIEALVDAGNHRMPTYRGKLTDIEIHNVSRYVVTLIASQKQKDAGSQK